MGDRFELTMPATINDVVILLGAKLIGLDSILPVAMELKHERPDIQIIFVILSEKTRPDIARNYVLGRGLEAVGKIIVLSRGDRKLSSRARSIAVLAKLTAHLFVRPALLLSPGDLAKFPFWIWARAARMGGGRAMIYCKPAYPGNPALNFAQNTKIVGRDMRFKDPGDGFLIYHPTQAADYHRYTTTAATVVGTPRTMPAWRRHLDTLADEGVFDIAGNDLRRTNKPLLLVFYCGPAVIPIQTDDVRESFLNLVEVLADEAPTTRIVVKPHPICDLELLSDDISRSSRPDISISHAHPQLLAKFAAAAISLNGSNVMNDMYVEGIPVIETTQYQADILKHGDSLYPNVGRIDASDNAALRRAIRSVVTASSPGPKPDPDTIAWPMPVPLAELLLGSDHHAV